MKFLVGDRVHHPYLGYGYVVAIGVEYHPYRNRQEPTAEVRFDIAKDATSTNRVFQISLTKVEHV